MNKIKKIIILVLLSCFICFSTTPSHAFITIDPGKGVGKVFVAVSKFATTVQEKIADLQEKIMGLKWVQDAQNAVAYIRETHETIQDVVNESQSLYNSVMSTDAVQMALKAAEISRLDQEIKKLEIQRGLVIQSKTVSNDALITQVNGQIQTLESNNSVYISQGQEENKEKIEENNKKIIELQSQLSELQQPIENSAEIIAIDAQIQSVKDEKARVELSLKEHATYLAKDFLDDVKAIAMSTDFNFVAYNQDATTQRIEEVKNNRAEEKRKVVKEVFARSINAKLEVAKKSAKRQPSAKQSSSLEAVSENLSMIVEGKISDIEELLIYAELLMLEMKLQTAVDLESSTIYKYQRMGQNKKVFDLEDYVFDYKKYKNEQLKNQPLSINELRSNLRSVKNIGQNLGQEFSGGLLDEAKSFGQYVIDSDNAGGYYRQSYTLEDAENATKNTLGNFESTYEKAMDLFN